MDEVWIFAAGGERAGEITRLVADLGFSPHVADGVDGLSPSKPADETPRRPALALVVAEPGRRPPTELVRRLREDRELGDVPLVLALSAEHLGGAEALEEVDEVLVHPFGTEELGLRISRARREVNGVVQGDVVRAGDLELNLATYQASIAGRPISFAYMEYELLKFFLTHPNRVFGRETLLSRVWGYDYYGGTRTVDVHVRRLRAKLGVEHAARLKTVRSVGYRFER